MGGDPLLLTLALPWIFKSTHLRKTPICNNNTGMQILIVKLGALGDVINTLPLAVQLKAHLGARITWLVEPLSFPLVAEHPAVDRAILFEKKQWRQSLRSVITALRAQEFDLILDLQRIWKSGLFCLAARGRRRIGFDRRRCKELTWLLPFERIRPREPERHMLLQYLEFAEHLGVVDPAFRWEIPVSGAHPFDLPERYLVLNIGATKPANKWTVAGFAGLSDMVRNHYGVTSILTGGREDQPMASAIRQHAAGKIIDLTGRTTISELKEVLAGAAAAVSCDTGPMHLAVAVGTKVIALFGPANPRRTGPFQGEVIQKQLPCVPCNRRTCSDPVCMSSITPAEVMEKLEVLWSAS